jgi:hypothetical protein
MKLVPYLRAHRAATTDGKDRGSMAMVMIIVIVGMALGALLVPIILTQSKNTSHSDTRVQALHQAESGISTMLSRLRGATTDGGVSGVPALLPCGPLSWPTASPTNGYTVTVKYYTSDPLIVVASANPPATPQPLACTPNAGPSDVPSFARITATGLNGTGNRKSSRTLSSTYAFDTTDVFTFNSSKTATTGGQIRLNPRAFFDVDETECLAPSGAAPEAGMALSVQACSTAGTPADLQSQLFLYSSDLSLKLVASVTITSPGGLCVTASTTTNAITLEPCATTGATNQQWRLNGNAAFKGTGLTPSICLAVRPLGTDLVAKACSANYDSTAAWLPTPTVGSGGAGVLNGQLVNFNQFGQCAQSVNDPNGPPSATNPFVLAACEQVPAPPAPSYQMFAFDPIKGQWTTTTTAGSKCLTRSSANLSVTVDVTAATCSSTNALQVWKDRGAAAADQAGAGQWAFNERYTIVDPTGVSCLSVVQATGQPYTRIKSELCDGSSRQKWNAGPAPQSSTVKDTSETPN